MRNYLVRQKSKIENICNWNDCAIIDGRPFAEVWENLPDNKKEQVRKICKNIIKYMERLNKKLDESERRIIDITHG